MRIPVLLRPLPLLLLAALPLLSQPPGGGRPKPRTLADAPGRDLVQRVCGSSCHGPEVVTGKGMARNNWSAVVNGMISRGAKVTESEFTEVVDYLAKNYPPGAGLGRGGGVLGGGPADGHVVDPEAADRGKVIYIAECVTCHGAKARGGADSLPPKQKGSDLVRSLIVIKDRYGAGIGAFLKAGHPMQSGKPSSSLDGPQIIDLSHFLHQKFMDTIRGGPYSQPINVLTGNPKEGEAYFNGAGGCNACHSVTGDLKGIGTKYDPVTIQQKFLFPKTFALGRGGGGGPRGGGGAPSQQKPVMVKVTTGGKTITGTLVHLDDFHVALREADGEYRSFARTASVKVEKDDPYKRHVELLDIITDKNMHDMTAYLESLK
jgi:mono/diheme cytochrome c family protein